MALALTGMPPLFDVTIDSSKSTCLRTTSTWLGDRGYRIVDVPYDGDCTQHAVAPAFAAFVGRPTTTKEIRELLVAEWGVGAATYKAELEHELSVELAEGTPGVTSVADLLEHWSHQSVYLPPGLVARATERITDVPVLVWAMGTTAEGPSEPFVLHSPDSIDANPDISYLRTLYLAQKKHMCRVVVHNTGALSHFT